MFYTLDWIIIGLYCIGIISLATYVSRKKSGSERSAEDYFLAGRSLPWWAIGASLIAEIFKLISFKVDCFELGYLKKIFFKDIDLLKGRTS